MVGRYLTGFKMLLHEPWQITCWDSKDGKGHHPQRSPGFPMLLWAAFCPTYCCLLLCSWLNHNLSKIHSLFCIYQHINFQLFDTGNSSISTQEKIGFFFSQQMWARACFFLKKWNFVQETDFFFYFIGSCLFTWKVEGRREMDKCVRELRSRLVNQSCKELPIT